MPANLDFLIIETYTQLALVLAVAAAVIMAGRIVWVARRKRRDAGAKARKVNASRSSARARKASPRSGPQQAFDRLASVITDANDRADHISETQSAAAVKLDSAEMAVNRLVAEIGSVMTVPKPPHLTEAAKPQAAIAGAAVTAPSSAVAATAPVKSRSDLAA